MQIRYHEEPFTLFTVNFEQWPSYAYTDTKAFPRPNRVPMPAVKGNPRQGRELFMSRAKGPCTGCHLIPGDDIWPAGSVGPDLSVIGDRRLPDQYLFDFIWDARVILPSTTMTAVGNNRGPLAGRDRRHRRLFPDAQRQSAVRATAGKGPHAQPTHAPAVAPYYGDNLDPATNPAIVLAEGALAAWSSRGPAGKGCADCHAGGPEKAMKGVAAKYPKYVAAYGRVMSVRGFPHCPRS